MKKSRSWLLPLACVLFAALACDAFVPVPPTQTPLPRTPAPETPTAEAGTPTFDETPPAGDTLDLGNPALYAPPAGAQTYRTALDFRFDAVAADGAPRLGRVAAQGAHRREPPELSLTIHSEGYAPGGGPQTVFFTQLGGTQYVVIPGSGCQTFAAGQTQAPFGTLLDSGGFLSGSAARVLPDETINGVPAQVYALNAGNFASADPAAFAVREVSLGRLYVAQAGGYVVRLLLIGVGTNEGLTGDPNLAGNIHYQLDFLDFGQPLEIAAPPECASAPAGPAAFPTLDDAFDVSSAGGLYSYKSSRGFVEAVDFYRVQMPLAGWTAGVESVAPPTALLNFTRGAEQASVTIQQEGAGITVAIASNQP